MLSYFVDENYAIILFLMLIATCAQHNIFMYSNNMQRLSMDVPNVGYAFGWNGDYITRGEKWKLFKWV